MKGDRAPVRKPEDNLRPEGEFYKRDAVPVPRGERADVKKPTDNLYPSGDFYSPKKADTVPRGERYDVKKPQDNLKLEGPMETRPKGPSSPIRGERAEVRKPQDNLRMKGRLDIVEKSHVNTVRGDRATVVRHSDNLTVGEGMMHMETTNRSQQQQMQKIATSRMDTTATSRHATDSRLVKNQTTSQIVLGDDKGDARFDRTTTARRTTVEARNLQNGHMVNEKSIETSTRQSAENRVMQDSNVEQKVLSQSMSAKSTMNQSIVLNDTQQRQQQQHHASSLSTAQSTSDSSNAVTTRVTGVEIQSTSGTAQVRADRQGTREVNVTREVTVTKKPAGGRGEITTTTTTTTTRGSPISQQTSSLTSHSQTLNDKSSSIHNQSSSSRTTSEQQSNIRSSNLTQQQQQQQSSQNAISNASNDQSSYSTSSHQQRQHQESSSSFQSNLQHQRQHQQSSTINQSGGNLTTHGTIITDNKQSSLVPTGGRNTSQSSSQTYSKATGSVISGAMQKMSTEVHSSSTASSALNSKQSSTSTHSRIVQGGSSGQQGWSSKDESAAKNVFATTLRNTGDSPTNNSASHRGSSSQLHDIFSSNTRQTSAGGSNVHSTSNIQQSGTCAVHSPQKSSTTDISRTSISRTSQGDQGRYSYSLSQQQKQQQQQSQQSQLTSSLSSSSTVQQQSSMAAGSRTQRIVRGDNLSVGRGSFDGQTTSRTYGGQSQIIERVVPVRSTQQSSISLGSYGNDSMTQRGSSSYKKEFVTRKIEPCPATLLESQKSPFKLQRQTSSHRFYMPNVSD